MPDICTLIVALVTNTVACMAPPSCGEPKDGRIFCTPGGVAACPQPAPFYECKREDGSTYKLDISVNPTFTVR